MNIGQSIDKLWVSSVDLIRTTQACFGGDVRTDGCERIWSISVLTIVLIAALIVVLIARRIIGDFSRHRAAIRRWQAEQAVASDDVMAQAKWQGDRPEIESRSQADLAAQIKEALRQNKSD